MARNEVVRQDWFAVRKAEETSCPISETVYNTRRYCGCSPVGPDDLSGD